MIYNIALGREVDHQADISGTSYTPEIEFASGKYQAFVRAFNENGEYGSYSDQLVFEVQNRIKLAKFCKRDVFWL